ncbi:hypothetical protein [Pedobacter psychroterrae]|uniref:Uncharacterized protein n=1 Tax=Pedobacter psychroterrae TaxID=2530453 RepID=A0A4R0NLN6_9SPHI|nr:hypothetical protein [Pedobacter psychroterrae]TCC99944.1 hypothetical protein EZ437_17040 [Pedobacter psychroterrae]
MKVYKEPKELSQHDRMRGDFKVLWPIVKDAFAKRLWLFNKDNRLWYTPEEFLESYQKKQMNNYEVNTLKQNLVIRDPRDGNIAYHKEVERRTERYQQEIEELRLKGEVFLNKVIEYYESKQHKS